MQPLGKQNKILFGDLGITTLKMFFRWSRELQSRFLEKMWCWKYNQSDIFFTSVNYLVKDLRRTWTVYVWSSLIFLELIFWSPFYPCTQSGFIVWAVVTVPWFTEDHSGTAPWSDIRDRGGIALRCDQCE